MVYALAAAMFGFWFGITRPLLVSILDSLMPGDAGRSLLNW